jgi:hypothetical protein
MTKRNLNALDPRVFDVVTAELRGWPLGPIEITECRARRRLVFGEERTEAALGRRPLAIELDVSAPCGADTGYELLPAQVGVRPRTT